MVMCTLAAKKINNNFFIFKNRDLNKYIKTKVILETKGVRKLLITDVNGHIEGLNEYGIGIIDATLRSYPRIEYQDSSTYAREVLDQKNIYDVIEIIKNNRGSVNSIVSDGDDTFIVEKTSYDFAITKIEDAGVITNTSIKLNQKNGSSSEVSKKSSEMRYKRGKELIPGVENFNGIRKFLSDSGKSFPSPIRIFNVSITSLVIFLLGIIEPPNPEEYVSIIISDLSSSNTIMQQPFLPRVLPSIVNPRLPPGI